MPTTNSSSAGVTQTQMDAAVTAMGPYAESVAPTTGQTISLTGSYRHRQLHLKHGALIATLTINLPANADSQSGDVVDIFAEKGVTALTIQAPSGTVLPALAGLTAVDSDRWRITKLEANKWGA